MAHKKPRKKPRRKTARNAASLKLFDAGRRKQFIRNLEKYGNVTRATQATGISLSSAYRHRRNNAHFAQRWSEVMGESFEFETRVLGPMGGGRRVIANRARHDYFGEKKRETFLRHLRETSNVRLSARRTGINHKTAYDRMKRDPAFARAWQEALDDGFSALAMQMLQHARFGVPRPVVRGPHKVVEVRDYDHTLAMRLLTMQERGMKQRQAEDAARGDPDMPSRLERHVEQVKERLKAVRPDLFIDEIDQSGSGEHSEPDADRAGNTETAKDKGPAKDKGAPA